MRSFVLVVLLTGALALAAGCAGDDSSTCDNLSDLQDSVSALTEIELGEGALDEIRASADEIEAELEETRDAAEDELGPELDAFESSLETLRADFDAAEAEGFSTESLTALVGSVSSASAAFQALVEAAPDCDL